MKGCSDGRCPEGQIRGRVCCRSVRTLQRGASMPRTPKRSSRRPQKRRAGGATTKPKGLQCPECDFVARHPMGLGRHRSTRHGVVSGRQARRDSAGGWLTRKEAARRAGVHYNTIRHWERTGKLRRSNRGGSRGALVSASDLEDLRSHGSGGGSLPATDLARIDALEHRLSTLLDGLEKLVGAARDGRRRSTPR